MAVICFASYEIHPTTIGGCGVLIHHATNRLIRDGHEVVLLLDMPEGVFRRFVDNDRHELAQADRCRAYLVEALLHDFPYGPSDIPCVFQLKSVRFAHAVARLLERERVDFIEFFEYCGPAYSSLVRRLFEEDGSAPPIGVRLHGSMEILHRSGGSSSIDRDQLLLYGLEHRALELAETVLAPSRTYFEHYYRARYGIDPERVVVSPPPTEPFPTATRRPRPTDPFTIVFLGRLSHVKGIDRLVHAAVQLMKRRPELEFSVELIGYDGEKGPVGGSYGAYLRTLVPSRLRDRFVFSGQLRHDEVGARLERALFAVFPNRVESFCYALHEVYDAGIPVIVNDLPTFADFFRDGDNALTYDGTTSGLLGAMERLIDDGALRERLRRPYGVGEAPLGDFYGCPRALRRLGVAAAPRQPSLLVVVLGAAGPDVPAVASLARQTVRDFDVVLLSAARAERRETLWWLGQPWRIAALDGEEMDPSDVTTSEALLVLRCDDRLHEAFLERSIRALGSPARPSFAGAWVRRADGAIRSHLDIAPELHPFEEGPALTRAVLRTDPGQPLADVFDLDLRAFGEIAYVWKACARWGPGYLFPEPLVSAAPDEDEFDVGLLKTLLLRHDVASAERIALLTAVLVGRIGAGPVSRMLLPPDPHAWRAEAEGVAEQLGGRILGRIALKRFTQRLRG